MMKRTTLFLKNFNWRMLLIRIVVNMLALLVTLLLVPKVYLLDRSLGTWFFMAVALGVLNAVIKPVIQVLTLRFIFATAGLVVILINAVILVLLSWIFPQQLYVGNIFWALLGGAVLGIISTFLENLLGLTPPIVSEKYPEARQRVKDRQFYRTQAELARIDAHKTGVAREVAVATTLVKNAHPNAAQLVAPAKDGDAIPELETPPAAPAPALSAPAVQPAPAAAAPSAAGTPQALAAAPVPPAAPTLSADTVSPAAPAAGATSTLQPEA
jgi:putative membrane protein